MVRVAGCESKVDEGVTADPVMAALSPNMTDLHLTGGLLFCSSAPWFLEEELGVVSGHLLCEIFRTISSQS